MPRAPFARIFSSTGENALFASLSRPSRHARISRSEALVRRGESEICRSSRSDRQNKVRASANNISPPKFFGLVGESWFRHHRRRRRARRIGSCASLSGDVPDTDAHLPPPFSPWVRPSRGFGGARGARAPVRARAARSRMPIVDVYDRRCLPSRSAWNVSLATRSRRAPLSSRGLTSTPLDLDSRDARRSRYLRHRRHRGTFRGHPHRGDPAQPLRGVERG